MTNFIKNWWNSEHCFAKNPLFWLLTAGACAASPFTGFLSLAAIPVFAGVAQTGYLPHDKLSNGVKWLFLGNSVNKGQSIPQNEDIKEEKEGHSFSSRTSQSTLAQIANAFHTAPVRVAEEGKGGLDNEFSLDGRGLSSLEEHLSSLNVIVPSSLPPEDQLHREAIIDLRERQQTEQNLSDERKWMSLSDEILFALAVIYKHRHVLHLNSQDEQEIATLLNEIPENRKPLDYSEKEQCRFRIFQKDCFSWQETDENFKRRLEEKGGRKIAAHLLVRFSDDHTRLSLYKDKKEQPIIIPFKTSNHITLPRSLQSICSFLNQMLIRVFVQKEKTVNETTLSYHNWQVSPDFFRDHDELDALYDSLAEIYHETGQIHDEIGQIHDEIGQIHDEIGQIHDETGQIHDEIGQIHDETGQIHDRRAERFRKRKLERQQRIAEMDERHEQCLMEKEDKYSYQSHTNTLALYTENLASIRQKIETDDSNFSKTISLMKSKISQGYIINPEDIIELVKKGDLSEKTVENLTLAIIRIDISLAKRCLKTSQNSQGFITQNIIERFVQEGKLPAKALQKLGFASPQQTGSSFFGSLLTRSHSGSSQSSKGTSSDEEKLAEEFSPDKKKVSAAVH